MGKFLTWSFGELQRLSASAGAGAGCFTIWHSRAICWCWRLFIGQPPAIILLQLEAAALWSTNSQHSSERLALRFLKSAARLQLLATLPPGTAASHTSALGAALPSDCDAHERLAVRCCPSHDTTLQLGRRVVTMASASLASTRQHGPRLDEPTARQRRELRSPPPAHRSLPGVDAGCSGPRSGRANRAAVSSACCDADSRRLVRAQVAEAASDIEACG